MAKMRWAARFWKAGKARPCVALLTLVLLTCTLLPFPAAAQGAQPVAPDIPAAYQAFGENDRFALYANPETLAWKAVDKRNGFVWSSNLDEKADDDRLNRTWTAFASSGISINFLDAKAQDKRASITTAKHTTDLKKIEGGFEAAVRFEEPGITVLVRVVLEADGVRVEVPFDGIKQENPAFRLGVLHLHPWLGATRMDAVPGYLFIPDGSGSLVRFSAVTKAKNMLYGRYYGVDLGMVAELPFDPATQRPFNMSLPVIGMAHNVPDVAWVGPAPGATTGESVPATSAITGTNALTGMNAVTPTAPVAPTVLAASANSGKRAAFISVLEKGAGYGEIQMHPAGVTTNFNFIYNAFIYNESYFQATNRAGAGVTALQRNTNAFDVVLHHRLLVEKDADYVGMARSYQQYLVEHGGLKKIEPGNIADIGIRLEFLGGEAEKVLFFNRAIPMTTVSQMDSIVAGLRVKHPQVIYYGWQPGGASAQPPTTFRLPGGLGTVGELRALAEKLAGQGGRLYVYVDPQAALVDQGGYSTRNDLAMSIGSVALIGYNREKVNHYFNLPTLTARYRSFAHSLADLAGAEPAIDGLGSTLYSDFKPSNALDRERTIGQYQALLVESKQTAGFYRPNGYVFGFMDAYFDAPLTDSGYIYTSETVPFVQIVLSGYVPYYGPALNFSSNMQNDLLKMADYGVYPSFFLTHEPTSNILNTFSNWIYTSQYAQWAPEAERTYAWLDALLGPVRGQPIIARARLAKTVTATTYANGKRVIVNYGDQPFTVAGTTVAARDAALVEVQ